MTAVLRMVPNRTTPIRARRYQAGRVGSGGLAHTARAMTPRLEYTRRMGRRLLGVVVVVIALSSCKGDAKKATAELEKRCLQLGAACGDTDKRTANFVDECKQAAANQAQRSCVSQTLALYDCFEKELCGKDDRVWSIGDLAVLADRHGKCKAELAAADKCAAK